VGVALHAGLKDSDRKPLYPLGETLHATCDSRASALFLLPCANWLAVVLAAVLALVLAACRRRLQSRQVKKKSVEGRLPVVRLHSSRQGALKMFMLALAVRCAKAMVTPRRLTARATVTPRISAGLQHTCGIRADNSLVECWGRDNNGQRTVSPNVPYTQITAGYCHTCGIRANNSLAECWGANNMGQRTVSPNVPYTQITAGYCHTCGIRANNSLAECWGANNMGQRTVSPNVPYTQITAGYCHTCGIRANNSLAECWGRNTYGRSTVSPNVPYALRPLPPSPPASPESGASSYHRVRARVRRVGRNTSQGWMHKAPPRRRRRRQPSRWPWERD